MCCGLVAIERKIGKTNRGLCKNCTKVNCCLHYQLVCYREKMQVNPKIKKIKNQGINLVLIKLC